MSLVVCVCDRLLCVSVQSAECVLPVRVYEHICISTGVEYVRAVAAERPVPVLMPWLCRLHSPPELE